MKSSNFHTHCYFCDGEGSPKEYVEEAIKRGIKYLGFSSHAPLPFSNEWTMSENNVEKYINMINKLKNKYKKDIEIYCGMEIDYFDNDNRNIFEKYPLDYKIGSVHFYLEKDRQYIFDGTPDDLKETLLYYKNDIKLLVKSYYNQIVKMVKIHEPDIIGHLDVIKKNNGKTLHFSEEDNWYKDIVLNTLDIISEYNSIVEINTGGILKGYIKDTYPSKWIIKECKLRNIKIILNADAHLPQNVNGEFDYSYKNAIESGYDEQRILINGEWKDIKIG